MLQMFVDSLDITNRWKSGTVVAVCPTVGGFDLCIIHLCHCVLGQDTSASPAGGQRVQKVEPDCPRAALAAISYNPVTYCVNLCLNG